MNRPARNSYDWDTILAKAQKQPGRWLLDVQLINIPARMAASIRLRRHRKLRLLDGVLEADVTNRYTDNDGVERATIWLRFTPHEPREAKNHGEEDRRPRSVAEHGAVQPADGAGMEAAHERL